MKKKMGILGTLALTAYMALAGCGKSNPVNHSTAGKHKLEIGNTYLNDTLKVGSNNWKYGIIDFKNTGDFTESGKARMSFDGIESLFEEEVMNAVKPNENGRCVLYVMGIPGNVSYGKHKMNFMIIYNGGQDTAKAQRDFVLTE